MSSAPQSLVVNSNAEQLQVVGMLIRARKYGLVDFEGEMLYQRQVCRPGL